VINGMVITGGLMLSIEYYSFSSDRYEPIENNVCVPDIRTFVDHHVVVV
jgi:hypothetical protein